MSSEHAALEPALPARAGNGALLRRALQLDAIVSGANGAVYLALGGVLDSALGVPASLLWPLGALLIVYAGFVWYAASSQRRAAAWAVIATNVGWAAASLAVLAAGWLSPTTAGGVWIALQALVVAALAGVQLYALRRAF
jgi:hypothetical protein